MRTASPSSGERSSSTGLRAPGSSPERVVRGTSSTRSGRPRTASRFRASSSWPADDATGAHEARAVARPVGALGRRRLRRNGDAGRRKRRHPSQSRRQPRRGQDPHGRDQVQDARPDRHPRGHADVAAGWPLGLILFTLKSGTLSVFDANCNARVVTTGEAFVEPVGEPMEVKNYGAVPAVAYFAIVNAPGAPGRDDAP